MLHLGLPHQCLTIQALREAAESWYPLPMTPKHNDEYPPKEAEQRRDSVLKAMLARPPEIHQPLNAKKRRPVKGGAPPKPKARTARA